MPDDSALSLEDAFAQAVEAEGGQTSSPEVNADMSSAGSEAQTDGEQAASSDRDEQAPASELDDLLTNLDGGEQSAGLELGSAEWWDQQVEILVDGVTTDISLKEMRDGTMMRADYTRKTQELARERQLNTEAATFYTEFREDPLGFSKYLAAKAEIIPQDGTIPDKGLKLFTEADVEERVQSRLEEALDKHPDVVAARKSDSANAVTRVFADLEQKYGSRLSDENRNLVLQHAKKTGTTDVEVAFESLLLRASQQAQMRAEAAKTSTTKQGGSPTGETPFEERIESVEDAFNFALRTLEAPVGS